MYSKNIGDISKGQKSLMSKIRNNLNIIYIMLEVDYNPRKKIKICKSKVI